jgi:hypothetical protein
MYTVNWFYSWPAVFRDEIAAAPAPKWCRDLLCSTFFGQLRLDLRPYVRPAFLSGNSRIRLPDAAK